MANRKGNPLGAGRKKGVPNKRTQAIKAMLDEMDCDPIEGMAKIALKARKDGDTSLEAQMLKELAPYHSPKLSASKVEATVESKSFEERLKELDPDA